MTERRARDTQLESWTETQRSLGPRQNEVLGVLNVRGALAGFQIARMLNRPTYTVLPRLTELFDAGFIRDSGQRAWNSQTKRNVIVWEKAY